MVTAVATAPDVASASSAPSDDNTVYLNRQQLSRALNVSPPTVDRYVEDGMPVARRGKNGKAYRFDLDACLDWKQSIDETAAAEAAAKADLIRKHQGQPELDLGAGDIGVDGHVARLSIDDQLKVRQADIAHQKAALGRGELVSFADVVAEFERVFKSLRNQLEGLADHVARAANLPAEAAEMMQQEIDRIRNELADELEGLEFGNDENGDDA